MDLKGLLTIFTHVGFGRGGAFVGIQSVQNLGQLQVISRSLLGQSFMNLNTKIFLNKQSHNSVHFRIGEMYAKVCVAVLQYHDQL